MIELLVAVVIGAAVAGLLLWRWCGSRKPPEPAAVESASSEFHTREAIRAAIERRSPDR